MEINSFWLSGSSDCCNDKWFSDTFSVISILSISIIHAWHFVTDSARYTVLAFLTGAQIFVYPLLRFSLPLRHLYPQWWVCLPWTGRGCRGYTQGIHTYTRARARARNHFGPTSFCGLYGVRRDLVFARVARKRFTQQVQFKPPWKRHRASRRAPDKALPSLPSCLSASRCRTLRARCRFTSPFCECANGTLVDCSRSRNSRLFSSSALPLKPARLVPAS